jgi:phosphoglycolate phosphatase-like HAD superfamily hydrolase
VKPAETIMIGDSRFDEGAAKAAGADFRWFTSFAALKL